MQSVFLYLYLMTAAIIMVICSLLLIAYFFDLTSSKTRIPSVILLLFLGWLVRQITEAIKVPIPDLSSILPVIGTIGLILIVLEGSLELELNQSKKLIIKKSILTALLPMIAMSFLLAYAFQYYMPSISFRDALTNAIPLCVISSSIAIPSVKHLSKVNKEFITYESSLSDIFGIIFFNFVALNSLNQSNSIGESVFNLMLMIAVSFIATALLSFVLSRIDHHIKFVPIILLILLIYSIAKFFHLPALIFILIFGLFLGNLDELKNFKWMKILKPEELDKEVVKFKDLNIEATFVIRALFFIMFGFQIENAEILNSATFVWAVGIVAAVLLIRAIQFKLLKLEMLPMLFIVPRGLINILLFISIVPIQNIPLVNKSLILQIILLTAFIMMAGLIVSKKKEEPISASENKRDE